MPESPAATAPNVHTGDGAWSVTTPDLTLRWERDAAGEVELASLQTAGQEWIASPIPLLVDMDTGAPMPLRDVSGTSDEGALRLVGQIGDAGLHLALTASTYPDTSVVRLSLEVTNPTDMPLTVAALASLAFATARTEEARLATICGGRWDEALPPRGYRLETIDLDELGRHRSVGAAADDGRSTGDHVPWCALLGEGGGLLASLVWSGRWRLDTTRQDEHHTLALGISDLAHTLAPGESIALPEVVLAGFAGDLDNGANAWRRWATDHWMPAVPEGWPWVQYNHWYAYFGDIDAARLLEEAREAAALGCEVFVIDDGWFRGRRAESYVAGWGDWVEHPDKFPDGIHAFGERVHGLGMKFGLWVEPERADDAGELVRRHPDWRATRGGAPIMRPGPDGDEGVHLCLGNPEVRRWMTDDMIRVVREYGVDWLKWDYNLGYGLGCDDASHGHQAGDGHHAHTLGLWAVLQDLRAACPDLMIENCASGGHRIDLGMLQQTHTNWVSDYTHRAASCRQHAQGAGLFLPLMHLNTWALEQRDPTEFRSRMGGAFGISSFIGRWSDEQKAQFRDAVGEYQRIRPLLDGERFLLTGPLHQDWDIAQYVGPDARSFAVLAFRQSGAVTSVRVAPRLPNGIARWRIERDGEVTEITSDELVSGLEITLPDSASSAIVWATALG